MFSFYLHIKKSSSYSCLQAFPFINLGCFIKTERLTALVRIILYYNKGDVKIKLLSVFAYFSLSGVGHFGLREAQLDVPARF